MRGESDNQTSLFSYVSLESRIPEQHPIRKIRAVVGNALTEMAPEFDAMYAASGRPSIPPEQLIRALLLQIIFPIHSYNAARLTQNIEHPEPFRAPLNLFFLFLLKLWGVP